MRLLGEGTMPKKMWRNVFKYLVLSLLACFLSIQPALSQVSPDSDIPLNQYGIRSINPYLVDSFIRNGETIDEVIVPPSQPPATYRIQAAVVPEPDIAAGINIIANVPALSWSFGCSATSAAMMFGYYDNIGYPNMYTGPTNGGIFPMNNATWGTDIINGESRALCPLSATRLGLDGRTINGHVDDYWRSYNSPLPDPFLGSWTEHTQGDCTADYMGTNQSSYGNVDGATTFYYNRDGSPLYDFTGSGVRDGCHGMRLFAESRGYQVVANYSQYIYGYNGNTKGFTFENFKSEIDAGRPVLIQVEGHTMLGYGYDDTAQIIYMHDTWDYNSHTMTWGGSYDSMRHYGVGVLRLASVAVTTPSVITAAVTSVATSSAVSGGNITSSGSSAVIASGVCWSTSANPTINDYHTSDGPGTGTFTSTITGLSPGTTYHVRAYATNNSGTAYGNDVSFTTQSATIPTVTTTAASSITTNSASSGGNITDSGSSAVTASGVCWSTSANPTINNTHTSDGTVSGSFNSAITGLSPNTTYHARAYAKNATGTAYGSDVSFTTRAPIDMSWLPILLREEQ